MARIPENHTTSAQSSASLSGPTSASDSLEQVDIDQMFTLIDGILPFEACLYYQVVPLSIQGSRLNLGMVNTADQTAADYVRRLVSYINCSIVSREISSDWHRDVLSQYLSHTAKTQQSAEKAQAQSTATNARPTLVVDSPQELDKPAVSAKATSRSAPQLAPQPAKANISSPGKNIAAPLHLQLEADYQMPLEALISLPPQKLMQALLSRVINQGIGRLYFEHTANKCRVLWSKDGVLQSILEELPPAVFQAVINELKRLTHLPMMTATRSQQVEIERLYKGDRLLIRFRVIPGQHGEEATLQVLRGAALKFHQQQQIDKLGRDALSAAQKLQLQINEIRDRAHQDAALPINQVEALPAIIQVLKQIESQVQELLRQQEQSDNTP
ncbi:MAG: hypothetical protein AAF651_06310 [Cyanobacteria bacterium P01_C01_bin.73]